jgi:hypothetical protein
MTLSHDEHIIRRLVDFAGDPAIVEEALEALRNELSEPPTLEQLLKKILELREKHGLGVPALKVG